MEKKVRSRGKLIHFPNRDKTFHEKWSSNDDLCNFPHPFRLVACGPPNSGKTTVIFNIIAHQQPDFDKIVVVHGDPLFTKEYEILGGGVELVGEIPKISEVKGTEKCLIIIDDIPLTCMGKEQQVNINRLFGFTSTHKNVSCIVTSQDAFSIPVSVRRSSNIFVLWNSPDLDSISTLARKTGLKAEQLKAIFQKFTSKHEALWVDLTDDSPATLRKDCYQIIV